MRFGERAHLPLVDPHGLRIALVESQSSLGKKHKFAPLEDEQSDRGGTSDPRAGKRADGGARPGGDDRGASWLKEMKGFTLIRWEKKRAGFGMVLVKEINGRLCRFARRPGNGPRCVGHGESRLHLAWRVEDETHQLQTREHVLREGAPHPFLRH